MSSLRPPGSGDKAGNPPAPALDAELAEQLVQCMRADGVDIAEARATVRRVDEAMRSRAELAGRPGGVPPGLVEGVDLRRRGFETALEREAAKYTASPATRTVPRVHGAARRQHVPQRRSKGRERFDRYRAELVAAGQLDADPRMVPRKVWSAARAAAKNPGRAIACMPKRLAFGIRRATLGESGAEQYTLEERRAVVVTAVVIWKLSVESRMAGVSRVTVGIPRKLVAAIVGIAVRGRPYELGVIFATRHRGAGVDSDRRGPRGGLVGDFRRGECGFVPALEQCGVLWRRQPPSDVVHARELGPPRRGRDGRVVQWAFTQYRFAEQPQNDVEAPATPNSSTTPIAPPATAQPP